MAVGSTSKIPPVEGLPDVRTWTNRDATLARELPASLLVMVGRGSPQWAAGLDASEAAVSLRARLLDAATEDVEAVGAVLAGPAGVGITGATGRIGPPSALLDIRRRLR